MQTKTITLHTRHGKRQHVIGIRRLSMEEYFGKSTGEKETLAASGVRAVHAEKGILEEPLSRESAATLGMLVEMLTQVGADPGCGGAVLSVVNIIKLLWGREGLQEVQAHGKPEFHNEILEQTLKDAEKVAQEPAGKAAVIEPSMTTMSLLRHVRDTGRCTEAEFVRMSAVGASQRDRELFVESRQTLPPHTFSLEQHEVDAAADFYFHRRDRL